MQQPFRFIPGLLILIVAAAPTPPRTRAFESADVLQAVESIGRTAIEKENVVGLTIGVAQADKILCTQAFGLASVELDVAATPETVFRIGSITKQFTAAAILLLAEEGKLNLDDPLAKFLPDYPAHAEKVSLLHLLQHTSGIKNFTGLPAYRRDLPNRVTQDEVIDRFKDLPLNFEPGEQYRYSNSGYFLLAVVVEKASGQSFDSFVEKRLFAASKLDSTYCDTHARIIPHRASGYSNWGGALKNARYIEMRQAIGAGNLASTAADLLRWQQALISHQLLTAESLDMMTSRGELNSGKTFDYGLGVAVRKFDGRDVIRHGGGINGFRSDLAYYPESGFIIAVLANSENTNASRISDRIARRLLAATVNESP